MEEPWSFTLEARRSQKRARFNLLALEHDEYYFQDYSAYFYPSLGTGGGGDGVSSNSSSSSTTTTTENNSNGEGGAFAGGHRSRPRQQGRLKLCSRGLLFEPADRLLPLVKYPFRHMETQMEPVGMGHGSSGREGDPGRRGGAVARDGMRLGGDEFRFRCKEVVESRRNDEVGPYVTTRARDSGTAVEWSDWTFTFSLLHTPLEEFLGDARRLREVALRVKERGHGYEEPLLRPLLEEILRGSTSKFDTMHLVDFRETLLLPCPVRVDRITPLLRNPGCIMVTDARVYFQPAELNNVGEPMKSFPLKGVVRAFKRRHMLRQTGLEIFMEGDGGSAFFNFESRSQRDELFDVLMSQPLVGPRAQSARDIEAETRRWQSGQVSNYDYLVFLNTVAGRTVNDLTQYPVFPWVVQDFESATLNFDDERVYRDLSRPIGALNAERLEYFRTRMRNMPDPELHPGQGIPPPFLYGTHYSTPGYALFFLVRSAPEEMLCLQNGRFDDPDRSFISVKGAWESVLQNHADLKELIPEFYAGDGSFLTNADDLQLGVTQGGQRVGDVELPPWARNPRDFVRKMRRALESPHVSRRLHLWIDLVFGYLQRGRAAIEADNLFYHLTYEGTVDLEKIDDPHERAALESQISEFGQCPSLLFGGPHPRRDGPHAPVALASSILDPAAAAAAAAAAAVGDEGARLERESTDRSLPHAEELPASSSPPSTSESFATAKSSNSSGGYETANQYSGRAPSQHHQQQHIHHHHHHYQQQHQQQRFPVGGVLRSPYSQGSTEPLPAPPGGAAAAATSPVLTVGNSVVGSLWKRGLAIAGMAIGGGGAAADSTDGAQQQQQQQQQQQPGLYAGGDGRSGRGVRDGGRSRQASGEVGHLGFPGESRLGSGGDGSVEGKGGHVERARSSPIVPRDEHPDAAAFIRRRESGGSNGIAFDAAVAAAGGSSGGRDGSSAGGGRRSSGAMGGALGMFPSSLGEQGAFGGRDVGEEAAMAAAAAAAASARAERGDGRGELFSASPAMGLGSASSPPPLPPALSAVEGSRRWHLDPEKVELRPGEPMAIHRDGITCAHLVQRASSQGCDALQTPRNAAGPTAMAAPAAVASDGRGGGVGRDREGCSGEFAQLSLCTSSKDGLLKVCSLEREAGGSGPVSTAYTRRRVAGGEMALSCCALTKDGKHAVAGSWNNSILLYSVEAACVLSRVEGAHEDGVSCLALHEEAGPERWQANASHCSTGHRRKCLLATGSWDAAVKVWEVGAANELNLNPLPLLELFDLETPAVAVAIDVASVALAAGGEDGMVAVWDITTGALSATFSACADNSPIVSIRWVETEDAGSGGRACLVSASAAGDVRRMSPVGTPLDLLRLDSEVVAMDSDGACTIVACRDGSLRLLSSPLSRGFVQTAVRESGHEGDITCLHVCAGDRASSSDEGGSSGNSAAAIVTGSEEGAVRVWDVMHRRRA